MRSRVKEIYDGSTDISVHSRTLDRMVVCGYLRSSVRGISRFIEAIKDRSGKEVLALLHDRLYQACQFYISRGYCTVGDRDNLEYMFKPYKALGGNGTGEELYNRCLALEYGPAERED